MIQFGWIEYGLVAFQSPHNLLLLDLLNYAAICGIHDTQGQNYKRFKKHKGYQSTSETKDGKPF